MSIVPISAVVIGLTQRHREPSLLAAEGGFRADTVQTFENACLRKTKLS